MIATLAPFWCSRDVASALFATRVKTLVSSFVGSLNQEFGTGLCGATDATSFLKYWIV